MRNCLKTLQCFSRPITHSAKFYTKVYNFTRIFTTLHESAITQIQNFTWFTCICNDNNSMAVYATEKAMRASERRGQALSFTLKIVWIGWKLKPNDNREKLCKTKTGGKHEIYRHHRTSETAPFGMNKTRINRYGWELSFKIQVFCFHPVVVMQWSCKVCKSVNFWVHLVILQTMSKLGVGGNTEYSNKIKVNQRICCTYEFDLSISPVQCHAFRKPEGPFEEPGECAIKISEKLFPSLQSQRRTSSRSWSESRNNEQSSNFKEWFVHWALCHKGRVAFTTFTILHRSPEVWRSSTHSSTEPRAGAYVLCSATAKPIHQQWTVQWRRSWKSCILPHLAVRMHGIP